MTPKPDILSLLEKLQSFAAEGVDEEKGSFKVGDSVTYDMFGGALSNSDFIRTLGVNEHALRISHNGAESKITEVAGEEVSRYSIIFEDGFTIKSVSTSELKAAEPSGTQPKPQEEPNLDAEALHLEDYSKDDLDKVKSKSVKTGDAIRKVEDDELKIAPDKVKKESKADEQIIREMKCPKCGGKMKRGKKKEGWVCTNCHNVLAYLDKKESIRGEKCPKCGGKMYEEEDIEGFACPECGYSGWPTNESEGQSDEIKQVVDGWKDNFSDLKFKSSVEVLDMLDNKARDDAWGKKIHELFDIDDEFRDKLKKAVIALVKQLGGLEESKLGEDTEFTPSRVEFKKIGDDQLRKLYKNACKSQDYWEKDESAPEKATAAASAVARYEEEMVKRGLISKSEEDVTSEKKESKFSFIRKQEPLWFCNECNKTFRSDESVCALCESKKVERIVEQAKEVFQVTWKNTDTDKEESTRVMAYDKTDAKREATRSNREITKVEGPITEEPRKESKTNEQEEVSAKDIYLEQLAAGKSKEEAAWAALDLFSGGIFSAAEKSTQEDMVRKAIEKWSDVEEGNKVPFDESSEGSNLSRLEDIVDGILQDKYSGMTEEAVLDAAVGQYEGTLAPEERTKIKAYIADVIDESKLEEQKIPTYIQNGSILTSKSGNKLQVTGIWVDHFHIDPEVVVEYSYETVDGKKGEERKSLQTFRKLLDESKLEEEWESMRDVPGAHYDEPRKEVTKPYTITWQNLDEPHGKTHSFSVNADSGSQAEIQAIATLKQDGIPEKFIEIKAVELKEREHKTVEDDPITAIEIVSSNVDPDAYNIRVVQLPEGSIVILDSVSDRDEAVERGKEFARDLNAKFLGIIDEKKVDEQEEDTFKTIAKGIEDKDTADKLAVEKEGQVVADEEDDKKFAVLVKDE